MRRIRPAVAAAVVLAALPLATAAAQPAAGDVKTEAEAPAPLTKGEAKLARLLKGRVAGEPRSCIDALPTQQSQTIDGTAYVYGSGSTIWVQLTRNPELINDRDTLVTLRFGGSQLCRNDQITTIDRLSGMFSGVVFFEDFVPYTRAPAPSAEG